MTSSILDGLHHGGDFQFLPVTLRLHSPHEEQEPLGVDLILTFWYPRQIDIVLHGTLVFSHPDRT